MLPRFINIPIAFCNNSDQFTSCSEGLSWTTLLLRRIVKKRNGEGGVLYIHKYTHTHADMCVYYVNIHTYIHLFAYYVNIHTYIHLWGICKHMQKALTKLASLVSFFTCVCHVCNPIQLRLWEKHKGKGISETREALRNYKAWQLIAGIVFVFSI